MECEDYLVQVEDSFFKINKLTQGSTVPVVSKPKTNAQKCKEYREKKKLSSPKEKKPPKSRAQINKSYYEKYKMSNSTSRKEYMKEYRQKKKIEKQIQHILQLKQIQQQQSDCQFQPSTSPTTSQQNDTRKKRKVPLPEAKTIVANVYDFFQAEYENLKCYSGGSCGISPLANIVKRTAAATGVSEETIKEILEQRSSEEYTPHAFSRKLARVTHNFENEDVSPIEEESSGESPDDAQHGDGDSTIDIEEHPINSLKVEIDVSEEHHSEANHGILIQTQPLSTQQLSAIHQSLPPTPLTHVEIKQEPVDVEDHEQLYAGDAVKDTTSFEVPICEQLSVIHQSLPPTPLTHVEIKQEPVNVEDHEQLSVIHQSLPPTPLTHVEIKQEPVDVEDHEFHSMMEENTDDSHEEQKRKRQINDSSDEKIEEERNRKNREKCKRYREKKKNEVATLPIISASSDPDEKKREEERRQKNREKSKRCREKKKNEVASLPISGFSEFDEKKREERKQKNREKTRRYRENKKKKNEIEEDF